MNYLFFDIEGANPKISTMCSFGYVLTDESFNVLQSDDITMNPQSKYDWYVVRKILHYTRAELAEMPTFAHCCHDIRLLLEDGDTLVFGFSIINDLVYLNAECKRYGLDSIDFNFVDIQKILCLHEQSKNQIGLGPAAVLLGLEEMSSEEQHRSDGDAIQSMKIFREMLKKGIVEMNALPDEACGVNHGGEYVWNRETPSKRRSRKKRPVTAEA